MAITNASGTGAPGNLPGDPGSTYNRSDGPPFLYRRFSSGWVAADLIDETGILNYDAIPMGSSAQSACIGNDSRLSNARTPTAHASSHVTGGSDVIANVVAGGNSGLISGADKSKLDGVATGANNYSHPNHSGDVTSVGDGAQTIASNAVTNAKAAQMATKTYKGRTSAGTGNAEDVAVATLKTDLGLVKADVGLGSVDNTSDSAKPVSTAQQTALDLKANLASPTFSGTPSIPTGATGVTQSAGDSSTKLATTAFIAAAVPNSSYRTILQASGSHTAAKVAGTYGLGEGDPLAVSGTGTLYPLATINIVAADYPTVNGLAAKLRIRAQLYTNDVAPTGNFTFGLYPITRPGTSGGAGLCIYTLGTVVSGSNGATFTTPAADGLLAAVSSDFALPADGHYVIGVVTTATVATSAHVHIMASLQMRNA